MSEDITMMLVWLGFFTSIFLGWYFYLKARNKERMALIEKDKDVSEIYSKREIKFKFPWLKTGIILTGFSFGFLVAFIFAEIINFESLIGRRIQNEPLIFGTVCLFTSIAIIIAYYVDKQKDR